MKMTYFKWSLTRFVRMLARAVFIWPVILLTAIPANLYGMAMNLDDKLCDWWIE